MVVESAFVELLAVEVIVDDCILDYEHVGLVVEKLVGFELINLFVVEVAVVEALLVVLVDSSYHQTLTSIHQYSNLPKDLVVAVTEMKKLSDYFVLVTALLKLTTDQKLIAIQD